MYNRSQKAQLDIGSSNDAQDVKLIPIQANSDNYSGNNDDIINPSNKKPQYDLKEYNQLKELKDQDNNDYDVKNRSLENKSTTLRDQKESDNTVDMGNIQISAPGFSQLPTKNTPSVKDIDDEFDRRINDLGCMYLCIIVMNTLTYIIWALGTLSILIKKLTDNYSSIIPNLEYYCGIWFGIYFIGILANALFIYAIKRKSIVLARLALFYLVIYSLFDILTIILLINLSGYLVMPFIGIPIVLKGYLIYKTIKFVKVLQLKAYYINKYQKKSTTA